MGGKRAVSDAMTERVAQNLFIALPLIRKRLLQVDFIQETYGIPLSHVQVLSTLHERGPMSITEISQSLSIAKPNITPLVDRLSDEGLVSRARAAHDRRIVTITILDCGAEKLAAIQTALTNYVRDWTECLTPSQFRELASALDRLSRILPLLKRAKSL